MIALDRAAFLPHGLGRAATTSEALGGSHLALCPEATLRQPHTRAANASPLWVNVQVVAKAWMTAFAEVFSLSSSISALRHHVARVVLRRPGEQVGGVHARRIVAGMTGVPPVGNLGAGCELQREAMGGDVLLSTDADDAVSPLVLASKPGNAPGGRVDRTSAASEPHGQRGLVLVVLDEPSRLPAPRQSELPAPTRAGLVRDRLVFRLIAATVFKLGTSADRATTAVIVAGSSVFHPSTNIARDAA